MKRIHLAVIGLTLAALLGLAGLGVAWARSQNRGALWPGMMSGINRYSSNANPVTIDDAAAFAERYVGAYEQDLVLVEVMEFAQNFYVEVEEKDTGVHAMELLVNKYTGHVYPEMGPNMMWNTKYGHMKGTAGMMGMMGSYYRVGSATVDMPITPEEAQKLAQQYLDANLPGLTADKADVFYGYYTLHTLQGGQIEGMLSVNGYSGAVWYHDWHGAFIGMKDFESP